MVQASQPETDSSTGTMILGVQCACRVIQWKDGDHSIEPCPLHAVADDLLKALERLLHATLAGSRGCPACGCGPNENGREHYEPCSVPIARDAIEAAKS